MEYLTSVDEGHRHQVTWSVRALRALARGETVRTTTSTVHGHTHEVEVDPVAARRRNPATATAYAAALVESMGKGPARSLALEEASRSEDPFWVEVLAEIVAPMPPAAPGGGAHIADPDAWARRLLGDKAPPGAWGSAAWLTAEEAKAKKGMLLRDRHAWSEAMHARATAYFRRRGPGMPEEKHRVFYLGTHRAGWLAEEPGKDVPPNVLAQWMAKVKVPLFISRRQLEKRKALPRAVTRWALDSGGFTEIGAYGSWKLGVAEYVGLVRRFREEIGNLDWAAPMDWMCEWPMTTKSGLSRQQHIARTVASFLELRSLAPELPIIPVLQGMMPEDYFLCAELYDRAGVDLRKEKVVGVGSICRRQEDLDVQLVLEVLANMGIRLHGFGFKKQGLTRAKHLLVSADSMAWSLGGRNCDYACPEGKSSCANCLHAALEWRAAVLRGLGPEWNW